MFNKFKQKIADGVEGVSVGRQNPTISRVHRNIKENKESNGDDEVWREHTKRVSHDSGTHTNSRSPNSTLEALLVDNGGSGNNAKIKSSPQEVLARVHHLIEVGRAQAQNNGRIEDGDGNVENENECDIAHIDTITSFSQDSNYTTSTPLEITQDELHEPLHLPSAEKHSPPVQENPQPDGALRSSSNRKNTRQHRKISANPIVNTMPPSERGDGEGAPASPTANLSMGEMRELYHKQDSSLKRYKQKFGELVDAYRNLQKEKQKVEAIARKQESKRHGEITEREEELQGLKSQVSILQNKRGDDREAEVSGEEEYENVMDGVMQKMNQLVAEQEEMQAQACILRDELKTRDATIMTLRAEEARSDERLRNALKQQEMELQMLFEEKESQLKNLFADKVHDLQRVMEENEKQKKITLYQKDTDVMRTKDELSILHEQLIECNERESKMKSKIDKIIVEKIECDKKLKDLGLQLLQEKEKQVEATNLNTKLLKEKQDETNEQISKMKRTTQLKVYELQDQVRKKTSELNETLEKHKVELDTKVKESTQFMQSEHAKASRKLENKVSDMKKMIKELRQKLTEKEGYCNELEGNVAIAKTEVEQAKSISATLLDSEKKIGKLNWTVDNLNTEIEEWKRKHNELSASFDDVSIEKKGLEEKMTEKDVCIKELLNMANDDDKVSTVTQQLAEERERGNRLQQQLQQMMEDTEDEEKTLQCELNNLKTKFSSVEEESREVTQQLHNKVNEVEALTKSLDTVNKRLTMKDSDLKETRLLLDELQAKYESFNEEKQHFESEHNQTVFELSNYQESETRLREEYENRIRAKDEEFQVQLNKLRCNKESSLETVTSQLEFAHQQELAALERRWKQECMTSTEELTSQLEEFEMKYCEYMEASEEERRKLVCEHEKVVRKLNHDVDALIQANEALRSEQNGSRGSIPCDQDVIALKESLKRLKEQERELHLYIEELSSKHEQEMEDLECRYKEQFISINENYENMLHQYAHEIETKLNEKERGWEDKLQYLEGKCHQAVITNNGDVNTIETEYLDEIKCLRNLISCKEMENVENTKVIECLKHEVEESNTWLNDTTDRYEIELSKVNEREKQARQSESQVRCELEQCKSELLDSRTSFQQEISTLRAKVNDDDSIIEELNAKIISIQINSNDMNDKMNQLFDEKHELEQKLYNNQHFVEKDEKPNKSGGQQTDLIEYNVSPSKNTYESNPENQKLLDLKRKTDLKISKLKKESRDRIEVLESSRREIEEKVVVLERHIKEQQLFHEEEMARSLEEYQETLRCASEKFEAEFNVVNDELLMKCEKVIELEERLDNMTVDKMNSLNAQKLQLENEYNEIIRKVTDENKKEMATLEQHMLKEFQEASDVTQQTPQEASEDTKCTVKEAGQVAQRDEQEIMEKYHQKILDLEKELERKEDALSNLKKDSEDQVEALHQQREDAEREHNEEFAKLEGDYYEVTRRYESFLENVATKEKEAEEEEGRMKRKMMEMEEKYLTKVEEMTENQKNELLAQEMKYKSQLKQAKGEMRRILISKGVLSPPNSSTDTNPSVEDDAIVADEVSSVCSNSDRPATLQLSQNHNGSLDISGHSDDLDTSPPKSPAPLEYEYLRNILYNYMMGKQCKQMAKVLTAIVHFTPVQVNEILTRVEEQEAKKEKKSSSWL